MKGSRFNIYLFSFIFSLIIYIPDTSHAEIKVKMCSLAQKGTAYSVPALGFKRILEHIAKKSGEEIRVVNYWSGIMGPDEHIVMKGRLGQIDGGYHWTIAALKDILPKSVLIDFPFLLDRVGGEGQWVRHMLRDDIINSSYKREWVFLHFETGGMAALYWFGDPVINTPENLRKHVICRVEGIDILNLVIETYDLKTAFLSSADMVTPVRSGAVTVIGGPVIYIVGTQAYTLWQDRGGGLLRPDFFYHQTGVQIMRRTLDRLPWNVKTRLLYFPMPVLGYASHYIIWDAEAATEISLIEKYNVNVYVLNEDEFRAFKEPIQNNYLKYVGKKPERVAFYNSILKYKKEFASKKNSIDTHLVHKHNQKYHLTNRNLRKIKAALEFYIKTGSLSKIKSITDSHIVEKWRIYDRLKAAEAYANNGDIKPFKEKFAVMVADPIVDELFNKHMDELKSAYGTKQAIKERISEVVYMLDEILKLYPTSYQKKGTWEKRTWM